MSKQVWLPISLAIVFSFVGFMGQASASNCASCDNCGNMKVNAGEDVEVDNDGTVQLDATINGSYDRFSWSCTGGSLSSYSVLDPTFRAADTNDSRNYQTCTITVYNGCSSESDSVRIDTSSGRDRSTKFRVALNAKPATTCAPTRNVDLVATLYDQPSSWREFTYYFDCDNNGEWDKVVTTDETTYTAKELCRYVGTGQYTARVKVSRGGNWVTDTDIIKVEDCDRVIERTSLGASVSITKTVKNLTGGSGFAGTVAANPGDSLFYQIVVQGNGGRTNNVIVRDDIPAGMVITGDPELNGTRIYAGSLVTGINIGEITPGQTKVITYTTKVAGSYYFNNGQTTLTNAATVTADGKSANSTAVAQINMRTGTLPVTTSALQSATMISTGFDGNTATRVGILLAGVVLASGCAWYFRKKASVQDMLETKTA